MVQEYGVEGNDGIEDGYACGACRRQIERQSPGKLLEEASIELLFNTLPRRSIDKRLAGASLDQS